MRNIVESYKRKLAGEDGWVLKRDAELRIALCYPNVYSIGMANLGFQAMYEIFNRIPEVSCERVFLPDAREMGEYERTRTPLLSLESQTRMRSEEHTSELQSLAYLVCRLLLEKKNDTH